MRFAAFDPRVRRLNGPRLGRLRGLGTCTPPNPALCATITTPPAPSGFVWQPTQCDANGCPINYQVFPIGAAVQAGNAVTLAAAQATAAQAAAAVPSQSATVAAAVPASSSAANWFTQESIISGVPNWAFLAGGGFALILFLKKK